MAEFMINDQDLAAMKGKVVIVTGTVFPYPPVVSISTTLHARKPE
jgi:hypothetical protein